MQSDSWNIDMDQDFRLKYQGSSWVGKRAGSAAVRAELLGVELNFANSTSFAFHDVCGVIRKSRSNVQWKRMYADGKIALEELNRRRLTIGFPPVSATYMRRFRVDFTPDCTLRSIIDVGWCRTHGHRPNVGRYGASLYVFFI